MTVKAGFRGLDFTREVTNVEFYMVDLSAANFDARITALNTVQAAVQGVSLIAFDGEFMYAIDTARESATPADPNAQRESKWIVSYHDDVNGFPGSFTIGGADLTLLDGNTQLMDVAAGAGLTLLNALEANLISRYGNAIVVDEIRHVGRNI